MEADSLEEREGRSSLEAWKQPPTRPLQPPGSCRLPGPVLGLSVHFPPPGPRAHRRCCFRDEERGPERRGQPRRQLRGIRTRSPRGSAQGGGGGTLGTGTLHTVGINDECVLSPVDPRRFQANSHVAPARNAVSTLGSQNHQKWALRFGGRMWQVGQPWQDLGFSLKSQPSSPTGPATELP